MATLGRTHRQLASLLWKASVEQEVDAEFAFHVEMRTREYIERGMSAEAARAAAVARFGDIAHVKRNCQVLGHERERAMKRTEYVSELWEDVRFALRQLARTPAFTAVAVLTLALGVGATTAIFSAVQAVVLRPFPYPEPNRLVFAFTHYTFGDGGVSVGDFTDWRKRSHSFTELAAFRFRGVTANRTATPERLTAAYATANVFPLYGVAPEKGRVFTVDEDAPGRNDVVVLSHTYWQRSFGGGDALGQRMIINDRPYTIIGVMPASFDPADSQEDLWIPAGFTPQQLVFHDEHFLTIVGRLKPGVTLESAQHDLDAVAKQLAVEFPQTNKTSGTRVQDFGEAVIGSYKTRLLVLLGAVFCVLLIACGNVANLLLARGAARAKELAIRTAIGAGRGRIVRQLLTESLVLAFLATAVGLLLAYVGVHALIGAAPATIPRLAQTRLDGTVLLFALGLSVLSAVLFGLVPAWRASRGNLHNALREGGRTSQASTRDRVRVALIVTEVGIALTLLVGAGLLIRSAIYLNHVDPGFDPSGMLAARVALQLPGELSKEAPRAEQTFLRIARELGARPGVQAAAVTSAAPFGGGSGSNGLVPEGKPLGPESAIDARLRMVSPNYLHVMRIPLVAGRDITEEDVRGGLRVMVVSEALAKAAWPGQNAIGKRLSCCEGTPDDPRWKTVIGVAADVHTGGPTQDIRPEFYLPMTQAPIEAWRWVNGSMTVVARARSGDGAALTSTMRNAVQSVDPTIPVFGVATMTDRIAQSLAEARFHLMLLLTLGVVGLLLAAAGIYSVIAYFVTLRTHEIGVRIALGATSSDIMRLLTWSGLRPVLAGAVAGGIAAAWSARLLQGSVYGVTTSDPLTFAAVGAVLLAVAFVAILVPARRAAGVDPTQAFHGGG